MNNEKERGQWQDIVGLKILQHRGNLISGNDSDAIIPLSTPFRVSRPGIFRTVGPTPVFCTRD